MSGWKWAPWGGGAPVPVIIGPLVERIENTSREIAQRVAVNNERIAELRGEPGECYPGGIGEGAI